MAGQKNKPSTRVMAARTAIPQAITHNDVLQAITDLRAKHVVHEFHDSERYDLVYEGERFAPKAVFGIAARRVTGRILTPADFTGGEGTQCFRVLRRLGFIVEKKLASSETSELTFVVGQEYNRREGIHALYGGQWRGGISTPTACPVIFLFTGDGGDAFGYEDMFRVDGVFLYTGEGQKGDMKWVRGNLSIRDSAANGKDLLLFEQSKIGFVRFVGYSRYLGHHMEERRDSSGSMRQAIVFELEVGEKVVASTEALSDGPLELPKARTLDELRAALSLVAPRVLASRQRVALIHYRAEAVKKYALARSKGRCEGCGKDAPFRNLKKQPYLEPHHTTRRADGGPDTPENVIALCPNCHRRVHSGIDGEAYNKSLIAVLARIS